MTIWRQQNRNMSFGYEQRPEIVTKPIDSILIANRGEIACRIIRTARRMGIKTIGVYSNQDSRSQHVVKSDEAYYLGPSESKLSYLNQDKLIEIALDHSIDAIHPGYGFLSENCEFASKCLKHNINFIGPSATAIRDMGIKSRSKQIMDSAGVPIIPGYHGSDQDQQVLLNHAKRIGFPVMIKAVKGGGGKGMRISFDENDFLSNLNSAKSESIKSFGDDDVLIEKYLINPRHIEVQIFGDTQGNYVSLYERDCSVQRRHQKIIEEAPAPGLSDVKRSQLYSAAVKAAAAVDYVGAGTVEFIYDNKGSGTFYFMEMNTRLQVEHPVTEMITGVDLVEWQIRVASGEPLPMRQEDFIKPNGHSFEARIYAEDTSGGHFMPGAGFIQHFNTNGHEDESNHVRIESGVVSGDEISVHYDPMIAKVVVWDEDRRAALRRLRTVLTDVNITGLQTNVEFLRKLSSHNEFKDGNIYTDFIRDHQELFDHNSNPDVNSIIAAAYGSLVSDMSDRITSDFDDFRMSGVNRQKVNIEMGHGDKKYRVEFSSTDTTGTYDVSIDGKSYGSISGYLDGHQLNVYTSNGMTKYRYYSNHDDVTLFTTNIDDDHHRIEFRLNPPEYLKGSSSGITLGDGSSCVSPMPGVIERILVKEGDVVHLNQPLITIMAMKMEYTLKSPKDHVTIAKVHFDQGSNVAKGSILISFSSAESSSSE